MNEPKVDFANYAENYFAAPGTSRRRMSTLYPFNPVTRKINECPYDRDAVLLRPSELKMLLADAGASVRRGPYCLFVPPPLSALLPPEASPGCLGGQYCVKATRSA